MSATTTRESARPEKGRQGEDRWSWPHRGGHSGEPRVPCTRRFGCAMHPSMRHDWAKHWARHVKPGGRLVTLIFPVDDRDPTDGPPFPGVAARLVLSCATRWNSSRHRSLTAGATVRPQCRPRSTSRCWSRRASAWTTWSPWPQSTLCPSAWAGSSWASGRVRCDHQLSRAMAFCCSCGNPGCARIDDKDHPLMTMARADKSCSEQAHQQALPASPAERTRRPPPTHTPKRRAAQPLLLPSKSPGGPRATPPVPHSTLAFFLPKSTL